MLFCWPRAQPIPECLLHVAIVGRDLEAAFVRAVSKRLVTRTPGPSPCHIDDVGDSNTVTTGLTDTGSTAAATGPGKGGKACSTCSDGVRSGRADTVVGATAAAGGARIPAVNTTTTTATIVSAAAAAAAAATVKRAGGRHRVGAGAGVGADQAGSVLVSTPLRASPPTVASVLDASLGASTLRCAYERAARSRGDGGRRFQQQQQQPGCSSASAECFSKMQVFAGTPSPSPSSPWPSSFSAPATATKTADGAAAAGGGGGGGGGRKATAASPLHEAIDIAMAEVQKWEMNMRVKLASEGEDESKMTGEDVSEEGGGGGEVAQ